ncbi:MAG: hypothetical protein C3F13_14645 [Anaerolineales bacterium]|nr:hypothetical protein [Anaerolineae bacterium]PWB51098.1 MAG: hypothetical protein C3F13_14645 [Anaerolineales bacterium]
MDEFDVVTGAFGFSGRYITRRLLQVEQGQSAEDIIRDAIGPETYTYRELVHTIGTIIGKNRPIISVSPQVGYWAGWLIGRLMGDMLITRDEIVGLMQDLLYTTSPPIGETRLTEWARNHASTLGLHYQNEIHRRLHREASYTD